VSATTSGSSSVEFSTENPYIKGKIEHSWQRTTTGYTVSYKVMMRRTNNWNGEETYGTINYTVYLNNKSIKSDETSFTVSNNRKWCTLTSGSKTVSLEASKSGNYTIGFSSSLPSWADAPLAFNVTKKNSSKVEIPVAMTNVGKSTLTLVDTGLNSFKIECTTGANGVANEAKNSYVVYTTDGSTPDISKSGVSVIATGKSSGETYKTEISVDRSTTVRAFTRTIGSQPDTYSYKDSEVITLNVSYYEAPRWKSHTLTVTYEGVIGRVSWGDTTGTVEGFLCEIYKEGSNTPITTYKASQKQKTLSFSHKDPSADVNLIGLIVDGDKIVIKVRPYRYYGDNTTPLYGDWLISGDVHAVNQGCLWVKTTAQTNSWKYGKVYVKTEDGWVRAKGLYAKTQQGWNESI
jgi:hypothetical protein